MAWIYISKIVSLPFCFQKMISYTLKYNVRRHAIIMNIAWLFYDRGIMLTDKKISKTDTTKNMYSYWLPDVTFTHNIYRTHVWFEPLLNLKDKKWWMTVCYYWLVALMTSITLQVFKGLDRNDLFNVIIIFQNVCPVFFFFSGLPTVVRHYHPAILWSHVHQMNFSKPLIMLNKHLKRWKTIWGINSYVM